MTRRIAIVAALVAALVAWNGASFAQKRAENCPQPSASVGGQSRGAAAPDQIAGTVTRIDEKSNMVSMRLANGTTQRFRASKDTLDDLQVGDRIEAKKRTPQC